MEHSAGFWQHAALPHLEERVSRSTWKAILSAGMNTGKNRASGEDERKLQYKPNAEANQAGIPTLVEAIKESRNFRPKSTDAGEFLCWDFASHGGCKSADGICRRGKHEVIKVKGLRPLIRMHMARRGGHRSEKRIPAKYIDGHVRSLRLGITAEDPKRRKKPEKWKETTQAGGDSLCATHVSAHGSSG